MHRAVLAAFLCLMASSPFLRDDAVSTSGDPEYHTSLIEPKAIAIEQVEYEDQQIEEHHGNASITPMGRPCITSGTRFPIIYGTLL